MRKIDKNISLSKSQRRSMPKSNLSNSRIIQSAEDQVNFRYNQLEAVDEYQDSEENEDNSREI